MTANQIVRVIPVLKVNNRNVNQRFYEETLGMKVLVEGRRSKEIGSHRGESGTSSRN